MMPPNDARMFVREEEKKIGSEVKDTYTIISSINWLRQPHQPRQPRQLCRSFDIPGLITPRLTPHIGRGGY